MAEREERRTADRAGSTGKEAESRAADWVEDTGQKAEQQIRQWKGIRVVLGRCRANLWHTSQKGWPPLYYCIRTRYWIFPDVDGV